MVADIRWLALFCILVHSVIIGGRVIDEDQEVFGGLGEPEDPYEDTDRFEDDRYEDSMPADQPQPDEQRPYRQCSSPADCYQDECCHIGMQRYSEPSCVKLGAEGDFCRVGQEPVNRTLYYPDGSSKELTNGHILFCPCSEGLTCLRALCRPFKELYLVDKTQENTL